MTALLLLLAAGSALHVTAAPAPPSIPVIVDTDIGDDTDDAWALVYALKNPRLDVKLITTTYGKPQYRGAIIARLLTAAGRMDIPIGLGAEVQGLSQEDRVRGWLADFSLENYKGTVKKDGAQALIDTILASPVPITIIAIGPLNTVGEALRRDPRIATRAHLVAMAGSIRMGYGNKPGQIGEYNVCRDIPDARQVFSAPWLSIGLAPLDTGSSVSLVGKRYTDLLPSSDPLLQALLSCNAFALQVKDPSTINFSGSGFDLVAVLLADPSRTNAVRMEKLHIVVDDQGKTALDDTGQEINVATSWKDLNSFLDETTRTLLLPTTQADREHAQP